MPYRAIRGWLRTVAWTGFAVLAVLLVAWIVGDSQAFEDCVHHTKNDQRYEALHQNGPAIGRAINRVSLNVTCAGDFADKKQGAITALATAVISLFTIVLVFVTNRQARLTGSSVRLAERALTELEAPSVFIQFSKQGLSVKPRESREGNGIIKIDYWFDTENIQYNFVNYGRTPAIIIGQAEKFSPLKRGSGAPEAINFDREFAKQYPIGIVIPPNGGKSDTYTFKAIQMLAYDDADILSNALAASVFFSVAVKYKDIFGSQYIFAGCHMFDIADRRWVLASYGYPHSFLEKQAAEKDA